MMLSLLLLRWRFLQLCHCRTIRHRSAPSIAVVRLQRGSPFISKCRFLGLEGAATFWKAVAPRFKRKVVLVLKRAGEKGTEMAVGMESFVFKKENQASSLEWKGCDWGLISQEGNCRDLVNEEAKEE